MNGRWYTPHTIDWHDKIYGLVIMTTFQGVKEMTNGKIDIPCQMI